MGTTYSSILEYITSYVPGSEPKPITKPDLKEKSKHEAKLKTKPEPKLVLHYHNYKKCDSNDIKQRCSKCYKYIRHPVNDPKEEVKNDQKNEVIKTSGTKDFNSSLSNINFSFGNCNVEPGTSNKKNRSNNFLQEIYKSMKSFNKKKIPNVKCKYNKRFECQKQPCIYQSTLGCCSNLSTPNADDTGNFNLIPEVQTKVERKKRPVKAKKNKKVVPAKPKNPKKNPRKNMPKTYQTKCTQTSIQKLLIKELDETRNGKSKKRRLSPLEHRRKLSGWYYFHRILANLTTSEEEFPVISFSDYCLNYC